MSKTVLGNIYEAITGLRPIPRAFVKRAVANGLDKEHLYDAVRQAKCLHKLPDYLLARARQKHEKGIYWDELGLKARARENFLEATLWALYAEILTRDPEQKFSIYKEYSQSYRSAAPYFAAPAIPVQTGFIASTLNGYLRLPEGETPYNKRPCVIILNSLCSPLEELHYVENSLLAKGFATLAMDYPGQTGSAPPSPFDVAEFGNSLCLFLSTRPEIDCSRIALYGISFGARIALYLALTFPDRFRSLVSISAPYDLEGDLDHMAPALSRELLLPAMTVRTSILEVARQSPIEGRLNKLMIPILVAGGGKDPVTLSEETRYIFEQVASPDKKLLLCPGAGHNLYEMMPSIRYELAQWMGQRA